MSALGSVCSWCGCRPGNPPAAGKPLPAARETGPWKWYLSLELPVGLDGRRRRIRRGGFSTRAKTGLTCA